MTPEDVVSKVFGVDRRTVTDATSNKTLPEWDSLGHMTLVVELETTYGVSLSAEDTLGLTDVAAIKQVLAGRGARW
jgi:citrate synthase